LADFHAAIQTVLDHEGGYSNDPSDRGGETKYGISKTSYPDLDIKNLTREEAIAIYERDFWIFGGLTSQRIATKLFDGYVNSKHHAIRTAQLALRTAQLALGALQIGPIIADGNYGAITESHLNAADEERFLDEYKARLCLFHCEDVIANGDDHKFLLGWLRRDVTG
jgi:lysozyme family protein